MLLVLATLLALAHTVRGATHASGVEKFLRKRSALHHHDDDDDDHSNGDKSQFSATRVITQIQSLDGFEAVFPNRCEAMFTARDIGLLNTSNRKALNKKGIRRVLFNGNVVTSGTPNTLGQIAAAKGYCPVGDNVGAVVEAGNAFAARVLAGSSIELWLEEPVKAFAVQVVNGWNNNMGTINVQLNEEAVPLQPLTNLASGGVYVAAVDGGDFNKIVIGTASADSFCLSSVTLAKTCGDINDDDDDDDGLLRNDDMADDDDDDDGYHGDDDDDDDGDMVNDDGIAGNDRKRAVMHSDDDDDAPAVGAVVADLIMDAQQQADIEAVTKFCAADLTAFTTGGELATGTYRKGGIWSIKFVGGVDTSVDGNGAPQTFVFPTTTPATTYDNTAFCALSDNAGGIVVAGASKANVNWNAMGRFEIQLTEPTNFALITLSGAPDTATFTLSKGDEPGKTAAVGASNAEGLYAVQAVTGFFDKITVHSPEPNTGIASFCIDAVAVPCP